MRYNVIIIFDLLGSYEMFSPVFVHCVKHNIDAVDVDTRSVNTVISRCFVNTDLSLSVLSEQHLLLLSVFN